METFNFKHSINLRSPFKIAALFIIALFVLSILSFSVVQSATLNTAGNTQIGTVFGGNDANAQSVSYFKCTTSGSVTDIIAYIDGTSTGNCIAAIYAVNGGSAGPLIEQSKPSSISTTFSWVDFQLPTPYTVTSGTTYGLAIMGNVPVNVMEVGGTGQRDHNAVSSYAKGFANPFGTIWGTDNTGGMSIYAAGTDPLTPSPSSTPISTPTPTPSPTPISTSKPTPTATPTPISTPISTPTLTPVPTPIPTPNPTPTPTQAPTTTPTSTQTSYIFGNQAIGTVSGQNDANAQSVSYFKCTTSGSVTDIIAYIDGTSTGNCIAAIYAVNGGSAGPLIEQSKPSSISTTFSWVDFQLPTPYTVTSGTTYGLAIMGNVPVNVMEVGGTGQRDHNAVSSYAKGFANPFGTIWGTDNTGGMSIYAVDPPVSPNSSPTSTPVSAPIASSTPTPTLTPTYTFNTNNLAPLTDGQWHSDYDWSTLPAANVAYEYSTTHNGAPTWKVTSGYGAVHSGISVKGGDHVIMSCWIKTTGTPGNMQNGQYAAVGMDVYGQLNGQWARIGGANTVQDLKHGAGWPNYINPNIGDYGVSYGQDWTLVTWDFIVPTTYEGDGAAGMPTAHQIPAGQWATVTNLEPWIGPGDGSYTCYFSDFQFCVNP